MIAFAEPQQATYVNQLKDDAITQYGTSERILAKDLRFGASGNASYARTASDIEKRELGDETERGYGSISERPSGFKQSVVATTDGEAIRIRSEVARDIYNSAQELTQMVGQLTFVTELQILKRHLSNAHTFLGNHPSESVFLSIVTLIEGALSQNKWMEYTEKQLKVICEAASIGYRQPIVSYQDYDYLRKQFAGERISSRPCIDLSAFSIDDLTDEENQEE